jgi:hypothetical protein
MKELFVAWILTMMTAMAPPARLQSAVTKEAKESIEDSSARYHAIAEDIVEAAFQEDVKPAFGGIQGRAKTAMMVATVFFMESGFRRDIDLGTSHMRLRGTGLNDFGRSWCMGQLNLGWKLAPDPYDKGGVIETSTAKTMEGWTGRDLLLDRKKCVIATISKLRSSFGACHGLPRAERLAQYARGSCLSSNGRKLSRSRVNIYDRWQRGIPNVLDVELLANMQEEEEVMPNEYTIYSTTLN